MKGIRPVEKNTASIKAVALLSGGLDSTLAVKLMIEQGIEVTAVNFISPFCTCSPRKEGGCHVAGQVARRLGVEVLVLGKGLDYMKIVEHPRFGHGRGMNPCIDCRLFMLRRVAELMPEIGASFVITGEVLGQRPMSQHMRALRLIERESGLEGLILRPLCARLLEPTLVEKEGLIDRNRLLDISGRSRRAQLDLAREMDINVFSCAAGGCLLTDALVAGRVRDLFAHMPGYDMIDVRLATLGRHFRLGDRLKAVVGRNSGENDRLLRLAGERPWMELAGVPGPVLIACGTVQRGDRRRLSRLLLAHAKKANGDRIQVRMTLPERIELFPVRDRATQAEIDKWRI